MRRYIVCSESGPLEIGHYSDTPKGGVLMHGDAVSVMPYTTARQRAEAFLRTVGNWVD